MKTPLEQWELKFQLEFELFILDRKLAKAELERREAVYAHREAHTAMVCYEGSFSAWKDFLTGRKEDRKDQLSREDSHTAQNLRQKQLQIEEMNRQKLALSEALAKLGQPVWPHIPSREMAAVRARHHFQLAQYLLEDLNSEMLSVRSLSRPQSGLQTEELRQKLFYSISQSSRLAETLLTVFRECNQDLEVLGKPAISIGSYFISPEVFLVSASPFGNLDRINQALVQIQQAKEACSKQLTGDILC